MTGIYLVGGMLLYMLVGAGTCYIVARISKDEPGSPVPRETAGPAPPGAVLFFWPVAVVAGLFTVAAHLADRVAAVGTDHGRERRIRHWVLVEELDKERELREAAEAEVERLLERTT